MKSTLLLKDCEDEKRERRLAFERDAKAGCTCDRWGHPCATCAEYNPKDSENPATLRPVPLSTRERSLSDNTSLVGREWTQF